MLMAISPHAYAAFFSLIAGWLFIDAITDYFLSSLSLFFVTLPDAICYIILPLFAFDIYSAEALPLMMMMLMIFRHTLTLLHSSFLSMTLRASVTPLLLLLSLSLISFSHYFSLFATPFRC